MKTATKIGKEIVSGSGAIQQVFRMQPPHNGHEYIVASAVNVFGPETYLFPSNADGEISDLRELDGSRRGTLSHSYVIQRLGYSIKES